MGTLVHLYSNLQRYTNGLTPVEVEGNTVGECLNDLTNKYPSIKPILFDQDGNLYSHIYVSVNLKSARSEQVNRPLDPGDQLYIILIVAGG